MSSFYDMKPIKLGCEVRGIDLAADDRLEGVAAPVNGRADRANTEHNESSWVGEEECYSASTTDLDQRSKSLWFKNNAYVFIEQIKKDVLEHRLLVFKNQGVICGNRQIEISKWFGDLEVTFYQHVKSPHPQVFRISNDPEEGCIDAGRSGWHIDGSFQKAPYTHTLYYMPSVAKKGATVFAPLTEVIEALSPEKYAEWDRLWLCSDREFGPIHPLLYTHPLSKKKVLCFHVGMVADIFYDYGSPQERLATKEEFRSILDDITHEFEKDNGKVQYKHKWEVGDFIISDNCALAHIASPETQMPRSQIGLRVLHRTTIHNSIPPAKAY